MNSARPHQTAEASAPGTGARIVASAGVLLARTNTVRAGVLRHLLAGEKMTGLEAVFGAGTTRLAAVVHVLSTEYGWQIERTDKVVGCKDGRVQTVTEYHLLPSVISDAMGKGAAAWCIEVRAARAELRSLAADAQPAAAQANAARGKRAGTHLCAQSNLCRPHSGAAA